MLDPEMIEDAAKIVNEAIKDEVRVNLIINNRAGGNAPLIAEKISNRLHPEKQQSLFEPPLVQTKQPRKSIIRN
jgi:phosphoheptose isomerase